jgi:hypothetical protein
MKRLVSILFIVALALLMAGCNLLTKSYYYSSGSANTSGNSCVEYTTSNTSDESAFILAGYTEGTCAGAGYTGHYCSYTSAAYSSSTTIKIYWSNDVSAATVQSSCTSAGYTYH